ncbi:hypothetical protein CTI12_AA548670 [Artemisia annua]|uniref:Phytosulfokine n=1 Tax=Artemisia annua TaxID=35608 RepID=A0A2U1KXB2_ARTAN|nr:hypothetical protein CTI12_AA548670 [Artemisia annua]
MARLENVVNELANVISNIVNKPATNTIWSVIQRLILGASVYYIWNERNIKRVEQVYRSEDGVFKCIVDSVRFKLMGLNLKHTAEVFKAADIWNIPIRKNEYYRSMVEELTRDNNNSYHGLMLILGSGNATLFIILSLMMTGVLEDVLLFYSPASSI